MSCRSKKNLLINHILRIIAIDVLMFTSNFSFAQKLVQVTAESMKNIIRQEQPFIRYLGHVSILHQGTTIICDSAFLSKKTSIIEAYGHVVVTKEGTNIYGDYLYYDGNLSTGKMSGKEVKMVNKDANLVTDVINFNSKTNSAYFNTSGTLTNADNKLISQRGYYFSHEKKCYFAGSVKMNGKDGRLFTDSLAYDTKDEIAYFYGPTRIYKKDSSYVYCEKGWYNRKTDQSNLFNHAIVITGAHKLYGQDIFYDKLNGYSRIVGDVAIVDTTQKVTVYGGKANYWDKSKEAEVSENPLLIMVSGGDTLFLRSNKLLVNSFRDLTLPDSTYRVIKALGAVRFFKRDLQGQCDSLLYNTKDSTISMFVTPTLWNKDNQITANFIEAFTTADNKIKRINFKGVAFFIAQEDTINFNQIRGKTMVAYFNKESKLSRLDVNGNAETVRFFRDEGKIAAASKAESSDLTVLFKNNKISKISFNIKPVSAFYPIEKVDYPEITLQGFKWFDQVRPKSKYDIIPKGLDLVLTDSKPGFQKDIKK